MQNTNAASSFVGNGDWEEIADRPQPVQRTHGADNLMSAVIGVNKRRSKMTKRSIVTSMSVVGLALVGPGMAAAAGPANRFANVSQRAR